MNNLSGIPANLTVGDSATWKDRPFRDQDGTVLDATSYALAYELRGPADGITLVAAGDGSGWKTTLDTATAGDLVPGTWWYAAVLTKTGTRITIAKGQLQVLADLANVNGPYDGRSQAEKALEDAEAALATFKSTSGKIKKYTIGARTMEFQDSSSILEVISYWKTRINSERKAKSIANGLGDPSQLYVRFR